MTDWNTIYEYSAGKLSWKVRAANRICIGDEAGAPTARGYLTSMYKGKHTLVHRIIWEMHNGPIPDDYQVDHIDHNRKNNLLSNLRLVLNSTNAKNRKKYSTNTTGLTGIYKRGPNTGWIVQLRVDGKTLHIGTFYTEQDVINAREEAKVLHGYHINHGK